MLITVTNVNGIKQYSIPDNIKTILFSILAIIVIFLAGLSYYAMTLHTKLSNLEENIQTIKSNTLKNEETTQTKITALNKRLTQKELALAEAEKENEELLQERYSQEALIEKELLRQSKLLEQKNKQLTQVEKEKKLLAREKQIREEQILAQVEEQKRLLSQKNKQLTKIEKEKKVRLKRQKKTLAKEKKKKALAKKKALSKKKALARKKALAKKKKLAKAKKTKSNKTNAKKKKKKKISKRKKPVTSIAKAKLGKRYVWGAVGPSYFDCSGFTSYVFRSKGINIPRTSRAQSKYGKLVDRKHLKAGDLIFFDTSRTKRGIINHVGLYLGNNKFIHASSAKKRVIITNLNKAFYSKRFKWARRIAN